MRRITRSGRLLAALALVPFSVLGQDAAPVRPIDVDILFNYYNQDGDHSAVTGGVGSEAMDVVAPVIVLNWQVRDTWALRADVGADSITSASVDAMDGARSTASEVDIRSYSRVTVSRDTEKATFGFSAGFSTEYDYNSVSAGLSWSRDFNRENTTLAAAAYHYADIVDLYDIHGVNRGKDDRTTSDLALTLTQVLGRHTLGSVEISFSDQVGFLSTPFQEVILAPAEGSAFGSRVAERLPSGRFRTAVGLRLNHAFRRTLIGRFGLRLYDDDWGISAVSLEIEPHFRVGEGNRWLFPILRFHDQAGSDYFGLPGRFEATDPFFTADRDLSSFLSEKYGLGFKMELGEAGRTGWNRFETRITYYTRDDGLESVSSSFSFGWSVR